MCVCAYVHFLNSINKTMNFSVVNPKTVDGIDIPKCKEISGMENFYMSRGMINVYNY